MSSYWVRGTELVRSQKITGWKGRNLELCSRHSLGPRQGSWRAEGGAGERRPGPPPSLASTRTQPEDGGGGNRRSGPSTTIKTRVHMYVKQDPMCKYVCVWESVAVCECMCVIQQDQQANCPRPFPARQEATSSDALMYASSCLPLVLADWLFPWSQRNNVSCVHIVG